MGIRAKLGIVFVMGLFLIGIGGGVMFAEFSAFTLGEEKVIGAESMETYVVQDKILSDTGNIYVRLDYVKRGNMEIVTDASMGTDEIEIEAEYNGKAVEMSFGANEDRNEYYVNYYFRDSYLFHYMDDFLSSIKDKKIPNYRWEYVGKHVIKVAPENASRIVIYN